MVSKQKIQTLADVKKQLKESKVVGIVDMHKLPARQLLEIKRKLKGKARIRVVKKRLIARALEETSLSQLAQFIQGEPGLLFSDQNPFKLAMEISASKSPSSAKPGDIAQIEIMIPAGPTNLAPGPAIGELQRIGLQCGVEGEKIAIKSDKVVAKPGDVIKKELAGVLAKLGIKPMEIGLNLIAVVESGLLYKKDVLFVPQEEFISNLKAGHYNAFNMSINISWFTKSNITILVSKGHNEAMGLAIAANFPTKETIPALFAKAMAQAGAIKSKTGG